MSSPSQEQDWSGHSCIFVANLPQRLTNEQLALALISTFQHFGPILSVKASRDARGRPFGFVDFCDPKSAKEAIEAAPFITIHFRSVRIEPAKCQRKLLVKATTSNSDEMVEVMKKMRKSLLRFVNESKLKMSTYQKIGDHTGQTVITSILKFDDTASSDLAYDELSNIEGWTVNWINSSSTSNNSPYGSAIRSSGLVHLVPTKPVSFSLPFYYHPAYQAIQPHPEIEIQRRPIEPIFEEQTYLPEMETEFEELSIRSDGQEKTIAEMILEATIFLGRLNSQKVSIDLLFEHLRQYGPIRYICLFNKGAISPVGIPLDSYAFVTFVNRKMAEASIASEHGTVWLGQTIKCEPARVLPTTPSVVTLYHQSV